MSVKNNNDLGDKIDQLQMCINNLKISKHGHEDNLLTRSQRRQVTENLTEALIRLLWDNGLCHLYYF